MKRIRKYFFFIIGIACIVGLDQAVKLWTVNNLALGESKTFIPGILRLTYVQNRGAAFGMLADKRWIFIGLTIVFVIAVAFLLFSGKLDKAVRYIPAIFIIGGGIGNLIDRISLGYVVDMFETEFMDFAVFNVADSFVTVAAFWVIIMIIITEIAEAVKKSGKNTAVNTQGDSDNAEK